MDAVLRHLHRAALPRSGSGLTDALLLERFLVQQEGAAFEALVHRHGPMVFGVCRRVLQNAHDAEDAFQATFLLLVRKATSIVPREMLGNWLYGVAYRTALKARAMAALRQAKERRASILRPEAYEDEVRTDLRPLLDRELSRLPDKYRAPLILCDLEDRPRREAAQQLGWSEGTLSGRLARARALLGKRLARHGLALAAGGVVWSTSRTSAHAAIPRLLVDSTVEAARLVAIGQAAAGAIPAKIAALVQGVTRAMIMTKVKITAVCLLTAGLLGGGIGTLAQPRKAAAQGDSPSVTEQAQADRRDKTGAGRRVAEPPSPSIEAPDLLRIAVKEGLLLPQPWPEEHLVRPDGTIGLGGLGAIFVSGDTEDEVRNKIAELLQGANRDLTLTEIKERLEVSILASNSKFVYVIVDEGDNEQRVFRFPIHGMDDVLDVLSQVSNLPPKASIWVARPVSDGQKGGDRRAAQVLPVDWMAITEAGDPATNYPLLAGDRVHVRAAGIIKPPRIPLSLPLNRQWGNDLKEPAVVEKKERHYQVEVTLAQADPNAKNRSKQSDGRILARPSLIVKERAEANVSHGSEMAVAGEKDGEVEFVQTGLTVRVKASGCPDGRIRLETTLERSDLDQIDPVGSYVVRKQSVKSVAYVKLGQTAKVVERDSGGQPRYWAFLRVVQEEVIESRTRAASGYESPRGSSTSSSPPR
jgi:RNA polymerase sigma factor (sigma-70 family)